MYIDIYNRVIHVFYVKRVLIFIKYVYEPDRLNRGYSHIMYKSRSNKDRISNCIGFMEPVAIEN